MALKGLERGRETRNVITPTMMPLMRLKGTKPHMIRLHLSVIRGFTAWLIPTIASVVNPNTLA